MIGEKIRGLRLERGWSAEETAKRLGVDGPLVERWEAGEDPGTANVIALARLFGVTSDFLLGVGGDAISLEGLTGEERKLLRRLLDVFDEQ